MQTRSRLAVVAVVIVAGICSNVYGWTPQPAASEQLSIQYVDVLPKFPAPVRDETAAESVESTYIANVIWSHPDVFASGAWIGGDPLREIYLRVGMRSAATAFLDSAGISSASYRIVDVPLSAGELESALLGASAVLQDAGVV